MKAFGVLRPAAVIAALGLLLFLSVDSAAASGSWSIVASPNPDTTNVLNGVAVIAPANVWAVGSTSSAEFGAPVASLVEHWDGSSWSVVSSPTVGSFSSLAGVTGAAPNDVWAVGSSGGFFGGQALVEHWDGSSWTIFPSPAPGTSSRLAGVAESSPRDIWAVGSVDSQTLIEHWDGASWSVVPSPSPGAFNQLFGVTAQSPKSAWAVGNADGATLIEHWDGSSWTVAASPNPGSFNILESVTADSPVDAWAVGGASGASGFNTLIEHWDGTNWNVVSSPNPGTLNSLLGVRALSSQNVWAVGDANTNTALPFAAQTLIEHWDGSSWNVVSSPTRDTGCFLTGVDFTSPASGWAVGSSHNDTDGTDLTLTEQFAGP